MGARKTFSVALPNASSIMERWQSLKHTKTAMFPCQKITTTIYHLYCHRGGGGKAEEVSEFQAHISRIAPPEAHLGLPRVGMNFLIIKGDMGKFLTDGELPRVNIHLISTVRPKSPPSPPWPTTHNNRPRKEPCGTPQFFPGWWGTISERSLGSASQLATVFWCQQCHVGDGEKLFMHEDHPSHNKYPFARSCVWNVRKAR